MTTALSVSSLVTSAIFAIYKRKPVIIIVGLPAMLRGFASGVFLFFSFFFKALLPVKGKKSHVPETIKDAKGKSQSRDLNHQFTIKD